MDQVNAIVDCDVERLNFPLRPFFARAGHNFVARFRRVPADVTALFVRLFRENGAYFDVTAHEHPNGDWTARIPAACFPLKGDYIYEVHATASDNEPAAIGEGRLTADPARHGADRGAAPLRGRRLRAGGHEMGRLRVDARGGSQQFQRRELKCARY